MKKYSLFELENTTLRQLDLGNNQITDVGLHPTDFPQGSPELLLYLRIPH
jgi:hypothetical protein